MTDAKTFTGQHIEVSPLGHKFIDYGPAALTIRPVTVDGQTLVRFTVSNGPARREVILNPADMVEIAETCISIFNTELEESGINQRLAIHNEQA